jgi:HD-GYP domain-containing protein (c-di-GMP phosphodiesterase class II)
LAANLYYFRPSSLAPVLRALRGRHKVIPINRNGPARPSCELPAVLIAEAEEDLRRIEKLAPKSGAWCIIYLFDGSARAPARLSPRVFAVLPRRASRLVLEKSVEGAFENLRSSEGRARTRQQLQEAASELQTLNKIGVALSTQRNRDALLELILTKSREITNADAGSLYLVEEDGAGEGRHLVFTLTQSDSHSVAGFRTFTLPINTESIAGFAAARGEILNIRDAYQIRHRPFHFNRDFDEKFGYRTKSMLVVPMQNQRDEVTGVLQLINAKRHPQAKLTSLAAVQQEVVPFSQRSQEMAASLASQAAVALENNQLYRSIERLFEGFVKASVTAIESRDPTTFGHSERVAKLTVGLADALNRSDIYKDHHLTPDQIQEIKYASLLHDFGKVGVREEVLVKAKKLYPAQLDLIRKRFLYIQKAIELEGVRKKLDHVLRHGNKDFEAFFAEIDSEQVKQFETLDDFMKHILQANEPTVLAQQISEKLAEIAGWTFQDPTGPNEALLSQDELRLLSIPKGSLDPDERLQIESHVVHSFKFLSQIPWTRELQKIPEIAKAHHEKLDGSGYPYKMRGEEIPFQAKMMTISDIFDALTARDRPYKRAVSIERALDIIGMEVKSRLLDPLLFKLFVEAKIYQLTAGE